jgi:hypothetical protein
MFKDLFTPKNLVVGGGFVLIFLLFFWIRSRTFNARLAMKSLGVKHNGKPCLLELIMLAAPSGGVWISA